MQKRTKEQARKLGRRIVGRANTIAKRHDQFEFGATCQDFGNGSYMVHFNLPRIETHAIAVLTQFIKDNDIEFAARHISKTADSLIAYFAVSYGK